MSMLFGDTVLAAAVSTMVKASVLLAAAAGVHALTRRRTSAAARHMAWTVVISGLLLLPILASVLPAWRVPVLRLAAAPGAEFVAPPNHEQTAVVTAPVHRAIDPPLPSGSAGFAASAPGVSWATAWLVLYGACALILLVRLALQPLMVGRLARRATPIDDPEWAGLLRECASTLEVAHPVRLLRSLERSMPMAFGTRSPAILLPAIADTWSDDRRRAVLLHELAHVGRHDCTTQMLAAAACAVYWAHPGVWWVARRLRIERELACDDRVLSAGTHAREYAGHLLELAHTLGASRAPALAVSMARPRQLEGRMLAVMDTARNRAVPGVRLRLAGVSVAIALILPLASLQATTAGVPVSDDVLVQAPQARLDVAQPDLAPTPARPVAALPAPARALRAASGLFGQSTGRGTWEIRPNSAAGTIHLRLSEGDSSWGSSIALDRLEGLTTAQLSGAGGPVRFSLRRDAGTFTFDGTARDGMAGGTFTFSPSPTFAADMEKRGVGRPTADEQYALARSDVGVAFLDELTAQHYPRPTIAQLVRAGDHGARLDYLRGMGAAGYRLDSIDALITLRDHGVTPDYVRELAAQGFKDIPAEQLRQTRDHGVTAEFVRAFREQGYTSATLDQLINARDHGVTAAFIRELGALGYRNLPLDEVVRLRDHGVSADYARGLRDLGQTLTVEQMVRARDHGVTVEFVSELAALGYPKLPIDSLIRVRDHGVTAAYVKEIKALGYARLEIDDLVGLRDHGVTPDKIRRANERAGTTLPLDMIKALASGGMK